jgi:hypothetical protein
MSTAAEAAVLLMIEKALVSTHFDGSEGFP